MLILEAFKTLELRHVKNVSSCIMIMAKILSIHSFEYVTSSLKCLKWISLIMIICYVDDLLIYKRNVFSTFNSASRIVLWRH